MNKLILVPESMYNGLLTSNDFKNRTNLDFVKNQLESVRKNKKLKASTKNVLYNQELRRYLALRRAEMDRPVKVEMAGNVKYITKPASKQALAVVPTETGTVGDDIRGTETQMDTTAPVPPSRRSSDKSSSRRPASSVSSIVGRHGVLGAKPHGVAPRRYQSSSSTSARPSSSKSASSRYMSVRGSDNRSRSSQSQMSVDELAALEALVDESERRRQHDGQHEIFEDAAPIDQPSSSTAAPNFDQYFLRAAAPRRARREELQRKHVRQRKSNVKTVAQGANTSAETANPFLSPPPDTVYSPPPPPPTPLVAQQQPTTSSRDVAGIDDESFPDTRRQRRLPADTTKTRQKVSTVIRKRKAKPAIDYQQHSVSERSRSRSPIKIRELTSSDTDEVPPPAIEGKQRLAIKQPLYVMPTRSGQVATRGRRGGSTSSSSAAPSLRGSYRNALFRYNRGREFPNTPSNERDFYPLQIEAPALDQIHTREIDAPASQLAIDYPEESRALVVRRPLHAAHTQPAGPSTSAAVTKWTPPTTRRVAKQTAALPAPPAPEVKQRGVKRTHALVPAVDVANPQWARVHNAATQLTNHVMRNPSIFGVNSQGEIFGEFGRTPAHLYPDSRVERSIESVLFPSQRIALRPPAGTQTLLKRIHNDPMAAQLLREALESRPGQGRRSTRESDSDTPTASRAVARFKPDVWQPPAKKRMQN